MASQKKPSQIRKLLTKAGFVGRTSSNKSISSSSSSLSSSPLAAAAAAAKAAVANIEELKRIRQRINSALLVAYDMEDAKNGDLLRELKDLAHGAADVLDEHEFEMIRSKIVGRATVAAQEEVRESMATLCLTKVSFEDQLSERIDKIRVRFDEILENHGTLAFIEGDEDHGQLHDPTKLPLSSYLVVGEQSMFGREKDKQYLVDFLLSRDVSGSEDISFIPIVGEEGVGKTNLAKFVYDDTRVFEHFPVRGWVFVSNDFDIPRLTRAIMESMGGDSCDDIGFEDVRLMLNRMLRGQRFLLVLDNVCYERHDLWDSLKSLFFGAETVKVILTTQSRVVAEILQTARPYHLGPLLEEQCLMLFQHYALEGQDLNEHANLVEIGKKIVEKCQGLPLAVKAIGSLLRRETNEKSWMDILECQLWDLAEPRDEILPSLRVSYLHLPAYLKPCFAYCAVFPKDHLFRKDDLVKLWMAQDMIPNAGDTDVEDIARHYFDELVRRSFLQPSTSGLASDHFLMHGLVYNLAQSIFKKESCLIPSAVDLLNVSEGVRHLYVTQPLTSQMLEDRRMNKEKQFQTTSYEPKAIRTILNLQVGFQHDLFLYVSRLRVLDVEVDPTEVLIDSIGGLKHLCYLRLRSKSMQKLPEPIYHLYNLQTLDIGSCHSLKELSESIRNLVKLRHLQLPSVDMPSSIGEITELRTVSPFQVGKGCSHTIRELKNLVNLNELYISQMENITLIEDAKEADLVNKKHLRRLILEWSCSSAEGNSADSIIKTLKPHTGLQTLSIRNYVGGLFPKWIGDPSFFKLSSVTLTGSKQSQCRFLPSLGQLASLTDLGISSFPGIQQIGHEFCRENLQAGKCAFPSLVRLEFKDMPGWWEWSGVFEKDFPRLSTLTITGCPKLSNYFLPPTMKSLAQRAATIDKKRLLHSQFEEDDDQI